MENFFSVRGDMVKSQKELIHNGDWGVLVILDACRFDAFEKVYDDYLSGELYKVKSSGSETCMWLRNTFDGRKLDVTYYSANPYINSGGHGDMGSISSCFSKIVDLHLDEWDDKQGTVLPETFPQVYEGETPAILHYVQPHEPYLSVKENEGLQWDNVPGGTEGFWFEIRKKITPILRKVLSETRFRALAKLIYGSGRPVNRIEKQANKRGVISVIDAYLYNLKRALQSIQEVVDMVDGELVVTADHGEFLGEELRYGHPPNNNSRILRNVPWLEVDGVV